MKDYYRAEWKPGCGWAEKYEMLCGPEGFECLLTEPEDRSWYRDGKVVITELNRLQADKAKLLEALKEIIEDDSTWAHIQNKCYAAIEGVS